MAKITKAMIASVVAIAAAPNGLLMLTQAEGADIVNAGLAVVDTANVEGDKAAVSLTEEGRKVAAENGGATAPAASPAYEIESGIEMPTTTTRRGRESGYPFGKLEIEQSFHVAKTAKNPDPASRLASSVSGARVRFSKETGETETVEVKKYQRGADGKGYAKDAEGKRIVESTETVTRPKLRMTRDFAVKSVGADDPKGEGARVWRIALPNG